jgi:hypothetical protein
MPVQGKHGCVITLNVNLLQTLVSALKAATGSDDDGVATLEIRDAQSAVIVDIGKRNGAMGVLMPINSERQGIAKFPFPQSPATADALVASFGETPAPASSGPVPPPPPPPVRGISPAELMAGDK